jgi:multisubunit Na+/H+ antiporter MnhF subunit
LSAYEVLTAVVMVGALVPALGLAAFGRPVDRLIGLELASASTIVAMLLFIRASGESYELIVPLVLVALSVVGTLVFTRLVGRPRRGS